MGYAYVEPNQKSKKGWKARRIQILGDGFRAMHSASIFNVGARLMCETEEEAGDTSFTVIGSL